MPMGGFKAMQLGGIALKTIQASYNKENGEYKSIIKFWKSERETKEG